MSVDHQQLLDGFLARHAGVAGTVHVVVAGDLEMVAATNIPPSLLEIVRHVPHGKGMAGAAQVQRASVQTCNLQTDDDGPFNPAARQAGGAAAIAIPVFEGDEAGDAEVSAVIGITFAFDGEIVGDELTRLEADARASFG